MLVFTRQEIIAKNRKDKGFISAGVEADLELLHGEVQELVEALESKDTLAASMELADVVASCYNIAESLGTNLDSCLETKIEIFAARNYISPRVRNGYKEYGTQKWLNIVIADTLHIPLCNITSPLVYTAMGIHTTAKNQHPEWNELQQTCYLQQELTSMQHELLMVNHLDAQIASRAELMRPVKNCKLSCALQDADSSTSFAETAHMLVENNPRE